jgi:hypothetical protein
VTTDAQGFSSTCSFDVTVNLSTLSGGECKKCDAFMTASWDFMDPNCVEVSSTCKDLSNVVLRDCNGDDFKFESFGNNQNTATLCHPSGLPITVVWIKAGCFKSGDGPGYGRRFDLCPLPNCTDPSSSPSAIVNEDETEVNAGLHNVLSSYPNPTNGPSQVVFVTGKTTRTAIEVYDMNGRNIASLFNQVANAGQEYRIDFNGEDLPNGVYIYRMITENETIIEKFMIAK